MPAVLTTELVGRVLVATLARPPVNAINDELISALDATLAEASADDGVVVLHLRSEQRAFCAGADLVLLQDCFTRSEGPDAMTDMVRRMQQLFMRLEAAPLITLAEIGSAALGGGLELALACDLRVAALEARLGLTEAGLGLVPGAGGTQRLTRLCGPGLAKRLILGAEVIDGGQAERLGLVQWARPRGQLAAFARELAAACAGSPKAALAASKRCIAAALDPQRNGFAEELRETRTLYDHPETRRQVCAFLARRAH
jgi:enoyl-CoA hydratase